MTLFVRWIDREAGELRAKTAMGQNVKSSD